MYAPDIELVNSEYHAINHNRSVLRRGLASISIAIVVYFAIICVWDLAGHMAACAQSTDPFSYAAGKVQNASTGFMLLIRVGMVIGIICICIYAWYKGGKVSPAWVMAIIVCGFIAVRADYVVNMFGTDNPIANVR